MAIPFLILLGHPSVKYALSFPELSRASFGIVGSHLADYCRSLLGLVLATLQTLIGGEAVYGLIGALAPPGSWGGALARGASYAAFWTLQLLLMFSTSVEKRLLLCARGKAV